MDKILVTGGSGLVGSYLKNIIPDATFISSKDYDLTKSSEVEKMFAINKPDTVIHLAAKVGGIIDNIENPVTYLDDNIIMNILTLKFAYKNNVKRFLTLLSCCVYPEYCNSYPIKEEDMHMGPPVTSTFSYGLAKRIMAVQIDNYNKQYNTKYNYLIPCNLYGINSKIQENKSHFVTALINKIYLANKKGEKTITLFGDGTPIRQIMHAQDVANIIKIVVDKNITKSFNLSSYDTLTINQIANVALKATNSEHIKIIYDNAKPNGQYRKDLDIEKFKNIIPHYECISMETGIKDYYNNLISLNL